MVDHASARIEHLKMLQAVIDRMARTSASMKQYALTIAAAAIAFAGATGVAGIALAAAVLMLFFWGLDARYLQQERWFRDLYDEVRAQGTDQAPSFRILPDQALQAKRPFVDSARSWSVMMLYLPLVGFLIVLALVLG